MRGRARAAAWRLIRSPLDDYLAALDRVFPTFRIAPLLAVALAFGVTWWLYVPVHELGHALGCWLGGGEVTRLEISPTYGAALLKRLFPFVAVGSDYAGQLTGFDTHGNDLTYMLTDFLPFLLTILIGVPLLRLAASPGAARGRRSLVFGASLPLAYAPFVSVTGDYYEMGSIVVTRVVAVWLSGFDLVRWRADDVFRLVEQLRATSAAGVGDVAGVLSSLLVGVVLAFATYGLGTLWARFLGVNSVAG